MAAGIIVKSPLLASTSTREPASHLERHAVLSFPPFRLDVADERLWNGERAVRLRRKPFAILRYLAQRPQRLVTYGELVEAVWGSAVAMSESLLRTHVVDVRRALGDGFVETVVGRGYRFKAAVTGAGVPPTTWVRGQHLKLVEPADASVFPIATAKRPRDDGYGRLLEQIANVIAASGLNAAVVLVVGDAQDRAPKPAVARRPHR